MARQVDAGKKVMKPDPANGRDQKHLQSTSRKITDKSIFTIFTQDSGKNLTISKML
jgi:hypothetical protein